MKKKILFFEPNFELRTVLLDQIIINKDFDVIQSNSLEDVKSHIEQSPVDLLIMGEDVGTHSLSLLLKFIKEINFTNRILFIKDGDSGEISSFEGFTNSHHVIEKPFRIQFGYTPASVARLCMEGCGALQRFFTSSQYLTRITTTKFELWRQYF